MKKQLAVLFALVSGIAIGHAARTPAAPLALAGDEPADPGDPDKVLAALVEGNERFVAGKARRDHQDAARVTELAQGQHPRACVLACSDSRVSPEIVLDQGLGDIFVIRVAGNVTDAAITGSVEYAVEHLATPLVLVLGHTGCGAVTAAVKTHGHPKALLALGPNIQDLVERIEPVLAAIPGDVAEPERIARAIEANARFVAAELESTSEIVRTRLAAKKVEVVPAIYDLMDGGKLHVLSGH
jgi:carbonic anhydrase